jgi:hypothetical protein
VRARLALVIGNQHYERRGDLRTPIKDAELVAKSLTTASFKVKVVTDATLEVFYKEVQGFAQAVAREENPIVVFFYAGHGAQIDERNYFIPVDIDSLLPPNPKEADLKLNSMDPNVIIDFIEKANPAGRNIFLFDGCRDNPFRHSAGLTLEGSAKLPKGVIGIRRLGENSVVVLSTDPGATSLDSAPRDIGKDAQASPFGRAVASMISVPALEFNEFFVAVQNSILDETEGLQKPQRFGGLSKALYLGSPSGVPAEPKKDPLRDAKLVALPSSENSKPAYVYSGSYALLIGVSKYNRPYGLSSPWGNLPGVETDIKEVDEALRTRHGFETRIVWNPTYDDLQKQLRLFFATHGRKDDARLLIYFAGHGYTSKVFESTLGWIIPSDTPHPETSSAEFAVTAFSMRRIQEFSEFITAKHVMWVFDSCFSGSIFDMNPRGFSGSPWEKQLYTPSPADYYFWIRR